MKRPAVDDSPGLAILPTILSLVAGSADVLSFVGLGGLFVAHITGNLVLLAAHIVTGTGVGAGPILAVPVFMLVLVVARIAAGRLEARGHATLRPLLIAQFVLFACCLALSAVTHWRPDPDSATGVIAAAVAVAALATQATLIQTSVRGFPATAVMTTNVSRLATDLGDLYFRHDPAAIASARRRIHLTWPPVAGFLAGACAGAALWRAIGLEAVALPTGLALVAILIGRPVTRNSRSASRPSAENSK